MWAKNKLVARELKGLPLVVLRPNRRASLPTYWSHPHTGADVLGLGKQGRRVRHVHLFTLPPSSFSSGHHLEHVADFQAPAPQKRTTAGEAQTPSPTGSRSRRRPCRSQDRDERIEEIADALGEFWNLGSGPITDLGPILEYHGIILIEQEVACEDMDAVSRWQGGRPFILYAKEVESSSRKLFNLAHELGHFMLHSSTEVNSKILDRMESQANRFAGAFLMPRSTFPREVANTSLDYLFSLKGRWRVAVAAMVYRCKELSILNTYQVKYIWRQMNARNVRKREPLDTAFSLSKPTVLASAVEMLLDANVKSAAQIIEELALNSQDIESLCGLSPGRLHQKVVPLLQRYTMIGCSTVRRCSRRCGNRARPPISGWSRALSRSV